MPGNIFTGGIFGGGGGAQTFFDLTDVLVASYVGQAGKAVVVNGLETGLVFGSGPVAPKLGVWSITEDYSINDMVTYQGIIYVCIDDSLGDQPDTSPTKWEVYSIDAGTAAGQIPFWDGTDWNHTETSELYWDDSNKRFGIGISTLTNKFEVLHTAANPGRFTRSTSDTNLPRNALAVRHLTDGTMADGFGPLIEFQAGDGSADHILGSIGIVREGHDDSGAMVFETRFEGAAWTERMRLTSTGKLGVGTSAPLSRLDVSASGAVEATVASYSATGSITPQLTLQKSHTGTVGTLTTTIDTELLGKVAFSGVDSGGAVYAGAIIQAVQSGAAGSAHIPTSLQIHTDDGSTREQRLIFRHDGRVGLGSMAAPGSKLHIQTTTAVTDDQNAPTSHVILDCSGSTSSASSYVGMNFRSKYNTTYQYSFLAHEAYGESGRNCKFHFGGFDGANYITVFTIDNLGFVGVGTKTPGSSFDVYNEDPTNGTKMRIRSKDTVAGSPPFSMLEFMASTTTDVSGDFKAGMIRSGFDGTGFDTARLTLCSLNSGGTYVDTLSVKDGKVGIGTSSLSYPIDVRATSTAHGSIQGMLQLLENNIAYSAGPKSGILFSGLFNSSSGLAAFSGIQGEKENATDGDYSGILTLHTRINGGNLLERVRITSGGNVGIGTTTPGSLLDVNGDVHIAGNLVVIGNSSIIESETVLISDNYLSINSGYITAVAQAGGMVVNYLPTATNDTVATGGFTAGVPATSNPTVATTGAAVFSAGDLIQISSANDPENNGLFEVLSHAANVLTIRGIGLTGCVETFTQNQFVTDTTVAGAIRKVTVSIMRAGTDGIWETGKGSVTGITFNDLSSGVVVDPGTAAGQMLFWNGSAWTYSETSELMWDDSNKRLGIKIATPQTDLHIVRQDSDRAELRITAVNASGGAVPWIQTQSARGTYASPSVVQSGDSLGTWYGGGWNGAWTNFGAYITMNAVGNWSGSNLGSQIGFYTCLQDSISPVLRLLITNEGNLQIGDSAELRMGTGTDFRLYHDGTNNFISSLNGYISLYNAVAGATEHMLVANPNGPVNIYYDGAKKFETASDGISVTGNVWANSDGAEVRMGTGTDFRLYHDGTNNFISTLNGEIRLLNNVASANEIMIAAVPNAGVGLYYNGSKLFDVVSDGVSITGNAWVNQDGGEVRMGAGTDFRLYHDGTNNYISSLNGSIRLLNNVASANEIMIEAIPNSYVSLYYNGSEKIRTLNEGVYVVGQIGLNTTLDDYWTGGITMTTDSASDLKSTIFAYNYSTGSSSLQMCKARGTKASKSIVQAGDWLGAIAGNSWDGNTFNNSAGIAFIVEGTPADQDTPAGIAFYTANDNEWSMTERMRLNKAGYLGIGTNNPTSHLHMTKAGSDVGFAMMTHNATLATTNYIVLYKSNGTEASPTATQNNDYLGVFGYGGYSASGFGMSTLMISQATEAYTNSARGSSLYFQTTPNGSTTPATRMFIGQNGRVTIGLTSTDETYFNGGLYLLDEGSGLSRSWDTHIHYEGSGNASGTVYAKSRGSKASKTIVQNGDDLGTIYFFGYDGSAWLPGARIYASVSSTPGTNDMPTSLIFQTCADGASGAVERMRINHSGQVGIGTPIDDSWNPGLTLVEESGPGVYRSCIAQYHFESSNQAPALNMFKGRGTKSSKAIVQSGDFLGYIGFIGYDGAGMVNGASIAALVTSTPGSNDMPTSIAFSTTADGASSTTERMRITHEGYLGINTTGPDRRLDILDASNPQLRLTYTDGSVYTDFQTDSSGYLSVTTSGGKISLGSVTSVFNSYIQLSPHNTSAGNTTEIRFLELAANGTNYVGFKAPDAISANVMWTLPSSDGTSGQLLKTNGSGVLSWESSSLEPFLTLKEPTGFPNRTDSVVTFDNGTRKLSIAPTGASFDIWQQGTKYTFSTTQEITISTDTGLHAIYFDAGSLAETVLPSSAQTADIIQNKVLVTYMYWNNTAASATYIGEERHGTVMDGATHSYEHFVNGLEYSNGLALNSILADQSGSLDTHAQFGVDSGGVRDEDIFTSISPITSTTGLPIYYMLGASAAWYKTTNAGYSVIKTGVGGENRLAYNQFTGGAWQLTQANDNTYVLCHVFATTEKTNQMIAILGQAMYTTLAAARTGANAEINSLVAMGTLSPEFRPIATVIFQTRTAYTNTMKARIVTTADGANYVDWRSETISRISISTSDHNSLSNLQGGAPGEYYHYAAGTAGSIPFFGNTSSLTQDNSNLFWDNSNKRLGIGISSPSQNLEVVGNTVVTGTVYGGTSSGDHLVLSPSSNVTKGSVFVGEYTSLQTSGFSRLFVGHGDSAYGCGALTYGFKAANSNPYFSLSFAPRKDDDSGSWNTGQIFFSKNSSSDAVEIVFEAANSSGTRTEKMRIRGDSGFVGIGTENPDRRLDILDASNPQLRLTHTDGSVYTDFQTDSSGYLTITPYGGRVRVSDNLGVGVAANDLYRIYSTMSRTDTDGQVGIKINLTPIIDTTAAYYTIGGEFSVKENVGNTKTDSGYVSGGSFEGYLAGAGTLAAAYGLRADVGTSSGGTGILTNAYGLRVRLLNQASGTITNGYGIYLSGDAYSGTFTTGYGLYIAGMGAATSYGIYQSSSTNLNYFAGNVGVNYAPQSTIGIYQRKDATDTNALIGIQGYMNNTSTDNGTFSSVGIYGVAADNVASGKTNSGIVNGVLGVAYVKGSGTISSAFGVKSDVGSYTGSDGIITSAYGVGSKVSHSGTGTITNAYGLFCEIYVGSGTITNSYGIYLPALEGTNKWGIYQNGPNDTNYFSGNVGINTTAPDRRLDVLDSSNPQIRLTRTDGSVYTDLRTDISGYFSIEPTGGRMLVGDYSAGAPGVAFLVRKTTDTNVRAQSTATNALAALDAYADTAQAYLMAFGSADGGTKAGLSRNSMINLEANLCSSLLFTTINGSSSPIVFAPERTEAMRITYDGRIGVGNTDPSGHSTKLIVASSETYQAVFRTDSTYSQIGFYEGGTGRCGVSSLGGSAGIRFGTAGFGTEWMRINASGRIGIGTSNPTTNLHITGGASDVSANLMTHNDTTTTTNYYAMFKSGGTESSPTATQSADYLGILGFGGYHGTGGYLISAQIVGRAAQAYTGTARGSNLHIQTTANDTTSPTTKMFVQHDGMIGIGTTAPNAMLDVYKEDATVGSRIRIRTKDTAAGSPPFSYLEFRGSTTGDASNDFSAGEIRAGFDGGGYTNSRLTLASATAANTYTDALHIKNGNVGIGAATTTPSVLLHVQSAAGSDCTLAVISPNNQSSIIQLGDSDDNNASRIMYDQTNNRLTISTNGSERMRISSAGKVGINTVLDDAFNGGLNLLDTGGSDYLSWMTMYRHSSDTQSAGIWLGKSRGSKASKTSVASGDYVGQINFNAYDGSAFLGAASINVIINGTPGTNDMPTDMFFSTCPDGSNASVERMRIKSSGSVGINTPMDDVFNGGLTLLDTGSSYYMSWLTQYRCTGDAEGAGIWVGKSRGSKASKSVVQNGDLIGYIQYNGYDGSTFITGASIRAIVSSTPGTNDMPTSLTFFTCPDGSATTAERLRITHDASFGFNTTSEFGSGAGVFGIANATTNPSTNPTGGGVLYSDGGAGKWRGPSGTISTFGTAEPHCPVCGNDFMQEWENPGKGEYLAVCMKCLTDELGDRPYILKHKN